MFPNDVSPFRVTWTEFLGCTGVRDPSVVVDSDGVIFADHVTLALTRWPIFTDMLQHGQTGRESLCHHG